MLATWSEGWRDGGREGGEVLVDGGLVVDP